MGEEQPQKRAILLEGWEGRVLAGTRLGHPLGRSLQHIHNGGQVMKPTLKHDQLDPVGYSEYHFRLIIDSMARSTHIGSI